MLTLADYHDQDDPQASQELVALSLPLPYVLEEIQNTLEMQLDQASRPDRLPLVNRTDPSVAV